MKIINCINVRFVDLGIVNLYESIEELAEQFPKYTPCTMYINDERFIGFVETSASTPEVPELIEVYKDYDEYEIIG